MADTSKILIGIPKPCERMDAIAVAVGGAVAIGVSRNVGDGLCGAPLGSVSKLSTYRDGWRILNMIIRLSRIERPIPFFGLIGALLALVGIILAVPLVVTYLQTGLVPRFPTAILATGVVILAFLCFFTGIILDTVVRGRLEVRRLAYLAQPAPGEP